MVAGKLKNGLQVRFLVTSLAQTHNPEAAMFNKLLLIVAFCAFGAMAQPGGEWKLLARQAVRI